MTEKCSVKYCREGVAVYLCGKAVCKKHLDDPNVWIEAVKRSQEAGK